MIALTLADVLVATRGQWHPGSTDDPVDVVVSGQVRIDSRLCAPGDLFVALPGEHVDGHDYAAAAHRAGAVAVVSARPIESVPCVVVVDPVTALRELAAAVLAELPDLVVVGITGSSGKTSTKDLIAELLGRWGPTVAPIGSYNNDLGVPLTVLSVDEQTRYLVLEMGSRGLGHIRRLTEYARPTIGVVLNIGSAHIGEFGTPETVALAKSELVAALPDAADGGVAILNADDPTCEFLAGRTRAQVWTFGSAPSADVRYDSVDSDDGRPRFGLTAGGHRVEVHMQLLGVHHAANAAAATAVALATEAGWKRPVMIEAAATGARLAELAQGLAAARPRSRWRLELGERADGVSIVNDSYNANPESMRVALDALLAVAGGTRRTWAVLGAMGELGGQGSAEHESLGAEVKKRGIDRLVAVGPDAIGIYAGAAAEPADEKRYVHVPDMSVALDLLRSELRAGDVVLVKASRSVGLDRLAAELLAQSPSGGATPR